MTLTVQITAKWVRNKKPGWGWGGFCHLNRNKASSPQPWFWFPGDLNFNRNAKYGALTGMSGAEDNDAIVAHWTMQPLSGLSRLLLIQKCLTKIRKKPRCKSRDAKKILWNQCPSRLQLSTHTKTLAASFTSPPLLLQPLMVKLSVVIIRSQEVKAVVKHVV